MREFTTQWVFVFRDYDTNKKRTATILSNDFVTNAHQRFCERYGHNNSDRIFRIDMLEFEDCEHCEEGEIWRDTTNDCTKYRGDCCGGCGVMMRCEECDGTGKILIED